LRVCPLGRSFLAQSALEIAAPDAIGRPCVVVHEPTVYGPVSSSVLHLSRDAAERIVRPADERRGRAPPVRLGGPLRGSVLSNSGGLAAACRTRTCRRRIDKTIAWSSYARRGVRRISSPAALTRPRELALNNRSSSRAVGRPLRSSASERAGRAARPDCSSSGSLNPRRRRHPARCSDARARCFVQELTLLLGRVPTSASCARRLEVNRIEGSGHGRFSGLENLSVQTGATSTSVFVPNSSRTAGT